MSNDIPTPEAGARPVEEQYPQMLKDAYLTIADLRTKLEEAQAVTGKQIDKVLLAYRDADEYKQRAETAESALKAARSQAIALAEALDKWRALANAGTRCYGVGVGSVTIRKYDASEALHETNAALAAYRAAEAGVADGGRIET